MEQSFSKTYLKGEALMQWWNLVVKGLGVTNSVFVVATLSVYQYGLYQLILAALVAAASVSAGLFDDVVVNDTARGLAERRASDAKRLFNEFALFKIVLGGVMTAALFTGSNLIAAYYNQDVAAWIRIASALMLVNALKVAEGYFFIATVSFSAFGTEAVHEFSKLIFLVGFFFSPALGLKEVLLATVGAATVSLAYSSFFFVREYRRVFGGVRSSRRFALAETARRYGRWVFLRYAAAKVIKQLRPWLIRVFTDTETVGLYAFAVNLITLAQSVMPIRMFGRMLPWEAKNHERLRYILGRGVKYVLWGGAALAAGAALAVPIAVAVVFPKYAPAMPVFWIMVWTLPLYGVYKFYKSLLVTLREQKILTARLFTESVLVVALNSALLPAIGILGAAVEYLATYSWRVLLFRRHLERAYPELVAPVSELLRFDGDDRAFFRKAADYAGTGLRSLLRPRRSARVAP